MLNNKPLPGFRTAKVQALLIYLAAEPDTPHRRETVMTLLWPGMPERSARQNLRQIIYNLRRAIPDLPVKTDDGQAATETAVSLYTGDFLADFYLDDSNAYEEWTEIKRQAYRRQALDALETLTTIAIRQTDYAPARAYAERQLEIDDLRESAYRQLMKILVLNGQRAEALALYDTCRRLLAEELGMAPTTRTTEVYEQIRAGALSFETQPTPGVRGFELKEKIGEGAYGTIHRAIQPAVGREVAVKVIRRKYADDPAFIRRFEAEAQTIARLEHPYIVPLYDYWREPAGAYLVMRLLRGGNLLTSLKTGPWDVEPTLKIVEQITSALAAAHRQGVIHRDIKPANILFDEAGNAYLSDFGIAKQMIGDQQLTAAGGMMGTPDYISPEQLRNEPVSPPSDLYSLGAVLYETLTGERPFPNVPVAMLIQKQLEEPIPPVSASRPNLPLQIDAVIQRATAKQPANRYDNALAMAEAFRRAIRGQDVEQPVVVQAGFPGAVPAVVDIINPYKGLRAFQEADASDFYGRETMVEQLVARLLESRFLAVVGPSGGGKSSLVKAGLIPALRQEAIPESDTWFVAEMVPGDHPLEELELALLPIAVDPPPSLLEPMQKDERGLLRTIRRILPDEEDAQLLLVIDQFEEMFTLVDDDARRLHFLNSLITALNAPRSPLRVVVTLRADFYDRPLQIQPIAGLFKQHTEIVLPLTQAELIWAIREPARRMGAGMEESVVTAMVTDVIDQPGALPLLQYALTELFEERQDNVMTLAAYRALGGVSGALAQRAEELFASFDAVGQEVTRQLFLRLVTLGEGVEDTRRRVALSELEALMPVAGERGSGGVGEDEPVVTRFSSLNIDYRLPITDYGKYRLLTFDHDPITREPTVEVAHEALLREWPRLRRWLAQSRDDVRLQRSLAVYAAEWVQNNQDEGFLLRDSRLDFFAGWAATMDLALTPDEQAFLDAGIAAREQREAEENARQQRELETAQQLAETERQRAEEQTQAALTAEAVANEERETAVEQAQLAVSRELASAALLNLNDDPERSILLAMQALSQTYTIERVGALRQAIDTSRVRQTFFPPDDFPTSFVTSSPDGNRIFSSGPNGGVMWDAITGGVVYTRTVVGIFDYPPNYVNDEWINRADFSPDGTLLVLPNEEWAGDKPLTGTITILSAETDEELFTFPAHEGPVQIVTFNPEGTQFAGAGRDGTIKVWDVATTLATGTGQEVATLCCHGDWIWSIAYSPDGTRLITTSDDDMLKMWSIPAEDELFNINIRSQYAVFSLDGQYLAVGTRDGTIQILESEQGNIHAITSGAHDLAIQTIAFSPDGTQLGTTSTDRTAKIWDYSDGEVGLNPLVLSGHRGLVNGLFFMPDGRHVVTGGSSSSDRTVRIWDVSATGRSEFGLYAHNGLVEDVDFSPDGSRLATASFDGTAVIWDIVTEQALLSLDGHSGWVMDIEYSPDGDLLATSSTDGTAIVWDADTGEQLLTLDGHGEGIVGGRFEGVLEVAFSPDGTRLATAGADQTARVWDLASGRELLVLSGHTGGLTNVVFSPDGLLLATSSDGPDGSVRIWDAESGQELFSLPPSHGARVWGLGFSPDGTLLATAGRDTTVKIWQLDLASNSGRLMATLTGHSNTVILVAFSSDGRVLATSGGGEAKLWDLSAVISATFQSGLTETIAPELLSLPGGFGLALSPDGKTLVAGFRDGTFRSYILDLEELLALARERLTRNWTADECIKYRIDPCQAEQ